MRVVQPLVLSGFAGTVTGIAGLIGSWLHDIDAARRNSPCVEADLMSLFRVGFSQHWRVLGRA